jgi:hypothetical protein
MSSVQQMKTILTGFFVWLFSSLTIASNAFAADFAMKRRPPYFSSTGLWSLPAL